MKTHPAVNLLNGSHFRLPIPIASWHPRAMPSLSVNPLVAKIRSLFQWDLALENDYLRQENKIRRSKFGARIALTDADRRMLVRFRLKMKDRLREVASIATPETFLAWPRLMKQEKWRFDNRPQRPGRPRKTPDTEAVVVKLAEENGSWGYQQIAGELKKLGHSVSPSYVRDVLRRNGLPPSAHRTGPSWKQFLQSHLDVTWAADFFTEEVWTLRGLVTLYVLFFIQLSTRRVVMSRLHRSPVDQVATDCPDHSNSLRWFSLCFESLAASPGKSPRMNFHTLHALSLLPSGRTVPTLGRTGDVICAVPNYI